MMTLWFVGAGVIGLSNALWVVIGANIWTTLTPWLVAFFGFKVDIEAFALPMIWIGWLATIIFSKSEKVMNVAKFLIWFWLLFLWLAYMKESVDTIAKTVSLEAYSHFSIRWYVLIWTLITAVMQTSTWATIITLTALSANIITLDMALGIVIWANVWSAVSTTIIWLLSSTPTQVQKKKVALSHLIFNISTWILVVLLYPQIKKLLLFIGWGSADHIVILSMFHTTFNIILAVIWAPLLSPLLTFLHWIIPNKKSDLHLSIDHVNTTLPEEIIHALETDTEELLWKVLQYNRHVLYVDHTPHYPQKTHDDYVIIKQIEEKLLKFVITSHTYSFTHEQSGKIHVLNDVILQGLTSSKYIKDIQHHIINLKDESITHSVLSESLHFFQEMVEKTTTAIQSISDIHSSNSNTESLETIITLLHTNDDHYLENMTTQRDYKEIESVNIAEVIKTNRYVLLSCEALLRSYIDLIKK
jgi:phosphate:Na+ symporter